MVSGLVTSPEDQSRICLLEASPIRIASNSLMSIKVAPQLLYLVLDLDVGEIDLCNGADLVFDFLRGRFARFQLDVRQVVERLVGRQRQLALLVNPLLALLRLLRGGLSCGRAERAGRQVDAQLL